MIFFLNKSGTLNDSSFQQLIWIFWMKSTWCAASHIIEIYKCSSLQPHNKNLIYSSITPLHYTVDDIAMVIMINMWECFIVCQLLTLSVWSMWYDPAIQSKWQATAACHSVQLSFNIFCIFCFLFISQLILNKRSRVGWGERNCSSKSGHLSENMSDINLHSVAD